MAQSPSSGDAATPFLIKVYAKPGPFRQLADFDSPSRVVGDEFKLHLWKTNTLRDIAQMLSEADSTLSTPLALHAFRQICYDSARSGYAATEVGTGITRVPVDSIAGLLSDIDISSDHPTSSTKHTSILGLDKLRPQIDDTAASTTLEQLSLGPGDFLDCAITPDQSLSSRVTPKAGSSFSRR